MEADDPRKWTKCSVIRRFHHPQSGIFRKVVSCVERTRACRGGLFSSPLELLFSLLPSLPVQNPHLCLPFLLLLSSPLSLSSEASKERYHGQRGPARRGGGEPPDANRNAAVPVEDDLQNLMTRRPPVCGNASAVRVHTKRGSLPRGRPCARTSSEGASAPTNSAGQQREQPGAVWLGRLALKSNRIRPVVEALEIVSKEVLALQYVVFCKWFIVSALDSQQGARFGAPRVEDLLAAGLVSGVWPHCGHARCWWRGRVPTMRLVGKCCCWSAHPAR